MGAAARHSPPPSHSGGEAEVTSGPDPRRLRDVGCLPPGRGLVKVKALGNCRCGTWVAAGALWVWGSGWSGPELTQMGTLGETGFSNCQDCWASEACLGRRAVSCHPHVSSLLSGLGGRKPGVLSCTESVQLLGSCWKVECRDPEAGRSAVCTWPSPSRQWPQTSLPEGFSFSFFGKLLQT